MSFCSLWRQRVLLEAGRGRVQRVDDVVHERQDLVVEVGIDENLHELQLESLFQVFHDRRKRAFVLAERVAAEARSESDFKFRRSPESIPNPVGGRRREIDRQRSAECVKLKKYNLEFYKI